MAYSTTTWGAFKAQLALRLSDVTNIYWISSEIEGLLTESLRTFGIVSGFWRARGTINTISGVSFYDIPSSLNENLLTYSTTTYELIKTIQFNLLESVSTQNAWSGTEMFTLDDLYEAIHNRLNQFLQDTGIVLTHSNQALPAPPIDRVNLDDSIIDVRRVVYRDVTGRYYQLKKEDENAAEFYNTDWVQSNEQVAAFSIMASMPVQLQLIPPVQDTGILQIISVNSQAIVNPASSNQVIPIFDDLVWIIKWGALADLLGKDGPARDPIRADFCETRYKQGVEFTKALSLVVQSRINNVVVRPSTTQDLDSYTPNWQNYVGMPQEVLLSGWNLLGLAPVPNVIASVTLDLIRKTPIYTDDADFVQLGQEQLTSILDYAEHLALFKVGGAEFQATIRQANNFLAETANYNSRLSASARYIFTSKENSQAELGPNPRLKKSRSLGALNNA